MNFCVKLSSFTVMVCFVLVACNCYPPGTQPINGLSCDPKNGQCTCQDHVVGLQCDTCEAGYWNINTGTGTKLLYILTNDFKRTW